jgi:hypothetical protein
LVSLWYNEVNNYGGSSAPVSDFTSLTAPNGQTVGHYTQLVWADSYALGCGYILHQPSGLGYNMEMLICNYGPGGNYIGSPIYSSGTYNSANCQYGGSSINGLCNNPLKE